MMCVTRRLIPFVVAGAFALLAATALAGSTVKVKSGTYKGTLGDGLKITLTVGGGKLEKASLSNIPLFCANGGGAPIPVKFGSAKIARSGAFSDHGQRKIAVGPLKGQVGEKLTLSGKFTSSGKVSGSEKTTFVLNGPHCTGKTTFSASR
jgi:hypothetical protein